MGRSPHSKTMEGLNKGAWTVIEDQILEDYIKIHGEGRWGKIPKETGLKRCGTSCRLRWLNYLRPDIKRGSISQEEEDLIIRLHRLLGNRWSLIAGRLPGRTDNEIKYYWHSTLSKKVKAGAKSSKQSKREDPIKELPSNTEAAAPLPKMDSYLTKTKPSSCDSNEDNVPPEALIHEYFGTNHHTLVESSVNGVLENISKEAPESDFTTCTGSDDGKWDFMMDLNERQLISFSEVLQSDFVELFADDHTRMVEDFSNDYKKWSLPSSLDENDLFSQELL